MKNQAGKQLIVVTGGAGFIGSHLVDALIERGDGVRIIDTLREGSEWVNPKAELQCVDICDRDALLPAFAEASVVFHLAAIPSVPYSIEHPEETHDVNVTGTLNVLEAARASGCKRVIFSSSAAIYGMQEALPLQEDMPADAIHPYGAHKYIGEFYCRLYNTLYDLQTVSLRYFNVYGPRMNPEGAYALAIGKFLQSAKAGKPLSIFGDGEQTRDFIHVRDVVGANLLAANSTAVGQGDVVNIGSGKDVSVNAVAKLIGGSVEYLAPRIEARYSCADVKKAQQLLGWRSTVPLEDGLKELKAQWGIA